MFGKAIRIFDAFGIPIKIDWSWTIVVLLVTWSLAVGWFPSVLPERFGPFTYWGLGLAGALGLFASILLHEMGHALVARKNGVPMRGITLFIFGGVAEMTREPPSWKAEMKIAVAGPVVSAILGAVFLGAAAIIGPRPLGGALLSYLGIVNLVLLGFNLLPGFPLDGGRVLRAALWGRRRSLADATRIATAVGSAVGFGLIALGVIAVFAGDPIGGIWFGLIGLFLRGAAGAAYRRVLLRSMFEGEPIGAFIDPEVRTAPPEMTIRELVDRHVYGRLHEIIPIVSHQEFIGVVSLDDIQKVPGNEWNSRYARDVMRPASEMTLVDPDRSTNEVLMSASAREQHPQVVVVEKDGKLRGVVPLDRLTELFRLRMRLEPPSNDAPFGSTATVDPHVGELGAEKKG